MTALSSLAAAITVPLYLALAVAHFDAPVGDDVGMAGVVARVFLITIVPLSIGMWIRQRNERWALANTQRAKNLAFVAFVIAVVLAVAEEFGTVTENFTELAIATLTFNVLAMGVSFTISRLARLNNRQSTAVAMELGIHNGTLAIAVAVLLDERLAIPAAVYSAFMFLTAGAFARLMYQRNSVDEPSAAAEPTGPRSSIAAHARS
jgi:BASS family bile acid:Na+ symporter